MNCENCEKEINIKIDGGICFLFYIFCSPDCFFKRFTLEEIKYYYLFSK